MDTPSTGKIIMALKTAFQQVSKEKLVNIHKQQSLQLCNLQSAPGRLHSAQTAFDAPRLNIRVIYFFRVAQCKYSAQEYSSANYLCLLLVLLMFIPLSL